jgi:hypothetical protein
MGDDCWPSGIRKIGLFALADRERRPEDRHEVGECQRVRFSAAERNIDLGEERQ